MEQVNVTAKQQKLKENVPGVFYIVETCIGCSLCYEISPWNFRMNIEEGYDYVVKQPETREEQALCRKAMQSCPADAIRNDGLGSLK
jgi:ferredoxin